MSLRSVFVWLRSYVNSVTTVQNFTVLNVVQWNINKRRTGTGESA